MPNFTNENSTTEDLYFCMWKVDENREHVGGDLDSNIYIEEYGDSFELSDEIIRKKKLKFSETIVHMTYDICWDIVKLDDEYQAISVYKLPKGTKIPDGYTIVRVNNNWCIIPVENSSAKQTCKCFFYDRTEYDSITFYNVCQNVLVFQEINSLPWVFHGYYKSNCPKISKKFKSQNKRIYKDPFGWKSTIPYMLEACRRNSVDVNNFIECENLISIINLFDDYFEFTIQRLYFVLDKFKHTHFRMGIFHVYENDGFSLMIKDCYTKWCTVRSLDKFNNTHIKHQHQKLQTLEGIRKSRLYLLGKDVENIILEAI